jgi:hypothetical protein
VKPPPQPRRPALVMALEMALEMALVMAAPD